MHSLRPRISVVTLLFLSVACVCSAEERHESFDRDPGWDGHNNRSEAQPLRKVTQDFGYSPTSHFGGALGEVGGLSTPDGNPAYYAKEIPQRSLDEAFSVSGRILVKKGAGNTLVGLFNHATINEWRTPNSLVMRINGRGDVFHVHLEYCTSRWRASAAVIGRYDREADRMYALEIPSGGTHTWSIAYDPKGNNNGGTARLTFDDQSATCDLSAGHKADGAVFDRFGILNVVKSVDSPGTIWLNDVRINDRRESFEIDPKWEGLNNRKTYDSDEVRPRFNFGYSNTAFCGGKVPGEIGGLFFRGDCRYPKSLACYGARLETLNLNRPLHAQGKITLRHAVSDSTTLFGFFHSRCSIESNPSQNSAMPKNFLGLSVEGPSSEGFFVYPCYRNNGEGQGNGCSNNPPRILPDGSRHAWTLDYEPVEVGGGNIFVSLDDARVEMPLPPEDRAAGAEFDRFGFVTPWVDGNGQHVYFDDVTYTFK